MLGCSYDSIDNVDGRIWCLLSYRKLALLIHARIFVFNGLNHERGSNSFNKSPMVVLIAKTYDCGKGV